MTVREIEKRVDKTRLMAGDPEVAHAEEDELWQDVLKAIRDDGLDCREAAALAAAALKTDDIDFDRWYA